MFILKKEPKERYKTECFPWDEVMVELSIINKWLKPGSDSLSKNRWGSAICVIQSGTMDIRED